MSGKRRNLNLRNEVPEYEVPPGGASQLSSRDQEIMETIGHKRVVLTALRQALADNVQYQSVVWQGQQMQLLTSECIRYENDCILALTSELGK